jgi:hypothetical protein
MGLDTTSEASSLSRYSVMQCRSCPRSTLQAVMTVLAYRIELPERRQGNGGGIVDEGPEQVLLDGSEQRVAPGSARPTALSGWPLTSTMFPASMAMFVPVAIVAAAAKQG